MINNLLMKSGTTLELRSDSNEWCEEWKDLIKDFYVSAYDFNGEPLEGLVIELIILKSKEAKNISLIQRNVAVTDKNGVATIKATIVGTGGVVCSVVAQEVKQPLLLPTLEVCTSDPLVLTIRKVTLAPPRIPLALDNVIDDIDFKNAIFASISAEHIQKYDQAYLMWGDILINQSINKENSTVLFEVSGKLSNKNEVLFQNKAYLIRSYIVNVLGEARYSEATHVYVERYAGGGALPYLSPMEIQDGVSQIITKEDIYTGVLLKLYDTTIKYYDVYGHEVLILNPLDKAIRAELEFTSFNNSGFKIETLGIPLQCPLDVNNGIYIYKEQAMHEALKNFLIRIGQGYFYSSYNITIDDKTFSSSSTEAFTVDMLLSD